MKRLQNLSLFFLIGIFVCAQNTKKNTATDQYQRISSNIVLTEEKQKKRFNILKTLNHSGKLKNNIRQQLTDLYQQKTFTDKDIEILWGITTLLSGLENKDQLQPQVENIYRKLSKKQQDSDLGRDIKVILYPPRTIKTGESMADADLYDMEEKKYNLSDFKDKYILLDFWNLNCGICIKAFPETGELVKMYKDNLVVISINLDTMDNWRKNPISKRITWLNLNDGDEMRGIASQYGVKALPQYVMISPKGIVLDSWKGHTDGSLKKKMKEHIKH